MRRFLALDVGNTHTTIGVMEDGEVTQERRLSTNRHSTADELEVLIRHLGGIENTGPEAWEGAAVCSVAPAINRALLTAVERVIGQPALLLDPLMQLGIRNAYSNPADVGMDRLANAVAGVERYGAPLIVVDFGTATTLDIVDATSAYLGGAILPGLEATAEALYIRTSKLPQVSIERPPGAIGRNTVDALRAGIYFGSVDAVAGMVARITAEMGATPRLVATGGLAPVLGPDIPGLHAIDPDLTLRGIHKIWLLNRD